MTRANLSLKKYNVFRFDAGCLSLNLVATVRQRGSRANDLMLSPQAFEQWLQQAGLLNERIEPTEKEFQMALLLREAIYATVKALILQQAVNPEDIALINAYAAFPTAVPQLDGPDEKLKWITPHVVCSCIALIARDAILLVGEIDRGWLKMCSNPSCQMLFVDASSKHQRRWCAMSICGNREKVAAHRQRKKA